MGSTKITHWAVSPLLPINVSVPVNVVLAALGRTEGLSNCKVVL